MLHRFFNVLNKQINFIQQLCVKQIEKWNSIFILLIFCYIKDYKENILTTNKQINNIDNHI